MCRCGFLASGEDYFENIPSVDRRYMSAPVFHLWGCVWLFYWIHRFFPAEVLDVHVHVHGKIHARFLILFENSTSQDLRFSY